MEPETAAHWDNQAGNPDYLYVIDRYRGSADRVLGICQRHIGHTTPQDKSR